MNGQNDLDRTLASWFDADALAPAPVGDLERVLDATSRRRPLPSWFAGPGSRWVGAAPAGSGSECRLLPRVTMTWATAGILLLLAALIGGGIVMAARLLHLSPLPAGRLGQLAYVENGDIFVADWDGQNPIRITDGPRDGDKRLLCGAFGNGPLWSPDGRHLAYRSDWNDTCSGEVFVSDPAGRMEASFPGVGWGIAWAPDSARIATWVDPFKTIGIYGADGLRQVLMGLPPGTVVNGDHEPYWSHDGTSLLLRLRQDDTYAGSRIWQLPVDGRTPRLLSDDDVRQLEVVYSPDGSRYASTHDPASASLVIAEADGTEIRVLPGAEIGTCQLRGPCGSQRRLIYDNPVWSSTGDRIAFTVSDGSDGCREYGNPVPPGPCSDELGVVDVATGTVTKLAGENEIAPLRFSPEGDRILYSTTDATDQETLWSVKIDGSDIRRLVPGAQAGDWQRLPADP